MTRIRAAEPTDIPAIASVHVASWQTSYRGIVPDEVLDDPNIRFSNVALRAEQWRRSLEAAGDRGTVLLLAQSDEAGVLGFASAGPERENDPDYRGELYAIYLLAAAQRRGIGRALVAAAATWLLARDTETMLVWVLRDNPACRFYERLGGVYLRQKPIALGPATLEEVCYGWSDLRSLVRR